MFGHKLLYSSSNRYGHKNTSYKFGHKSRTSKYAPQMLDDCDEDKVPKSGLERHHSTREQHAYHNSHNPAHR